ncbi:MAG: class I SAM-dependent methyltransferase [Alphaproteobacteria bacterium]|nr:class I SAM-dependent methyltransferase [Kordiimonadaceae bacterium]MBO6629627.1 class I SAM-dependent methyltransferase [Alphaproteobacteria bacterium]
MATFANLKKILVNIPRAVRDPGRAVSLAYRRMFPFGISPKDPEAYRIGAWSFGDLPRVDLREIFPGIDAAEVRVLRSYDRKRDLSLDAQEVLALMAIASFIQPKKIIEIGTSDGNTTVNLLANAADEAVITTFDLPVDWSGDFEIYVPEMMRNVTDRSAVGRQYRSSVYADRVIQVLGDSAQVDFDQLDGPFDLAFIDGCHFYDYVKKDTENVLGRMSPGGVVVWHDYGMLSDVSRAVDELPRDMNIKVVAGTRLAIARLAS